MLKMFVFILFFCISNTYAYQYDLSICAIFRDEAPYLKEWIEFHRMLGVQHFYLCSHNSIDNYKDVLKPYIRKGIVELKEIWTDPNADIVSFTFNFQLPWYNECLIKSKNESK